MARYKTSAWEWHRRQILKRDLYSCQMCGVLLSSGKRDHRAAVVDHKRPARLRPDLPGWHESEGIWHEVNTALKYNKPVFMMMERPR
jgi:5-methylcytosine-specific restriction endonuclease McrA